MSIESTVLFLAAAALLVATPGPDMLFVGAQAVQSGARSALAAAAGVAGGVSLHAAFAAAGLSALLAATPWLFTAVRVAGGLYLVFLGLRCWRAAGRGRPTPNASLPGIPPGAAFLRGFATNALNPKVALFFLALLPQFVPATAERPGLVMLGYGAIYGLMTLIAYGALAVAAGAGTKRLRRGRRWQAFADRATGAVFIGLGARLLISEGR